MEAPPPDASPALMEEPPAQEVALADDGAADGLAIATSHGVTQFGCCAKTGACCPGMHAA